MIEAGVGNLRPA